MQAGYRSPWSRYVGGATRPTGVSLRQYGFRSLLWFHGSGGCKPKSIGDYAGPRSMLAFWMGGGNFRFAPVPEISPPKSDVVSGGLPYAKHHKKPIDDDEVLEFLEIWTTWNDVE